MCPMHYRRVRIHGWTDAPKLVDNFARYTIDSGTGCWAWNGPTDGKGYGFFSRPHLGEKRAHRAFWAEYVAPVREGMEIDHLCRNRGCVNPDHMEEVTHWENMQRAELGQWGIERCRSGKHDVTGPDAWVVFPNRPDDRWCRICAEESYQRGLARNRKAEFPRSTHCRNGHERTPENTKITKDGTKYCWTCRKIRAAKGSP